jgi:excisionase family DNA binding protein
MIKNKHEYITSAEAAKQLGFSPDYVRKLISTGKMVGEKLGRNWILNIQELKKITRQRISMVRKKKEK